WIQPLSQDQWPSYQVLVGGRKRNVSIGYHSVSSEYFANVLENAASGSSDRLNLMLNSPVVSMSPDAVVLQNGQAIQAKVVIDNRGPSESVRDSMMQGSFPGGFQKFWGFELALPSDWPIEHPVIMDDRVDQADGFRFVYTLPFESRRVLVEDTRFSNSSDLDRGDCFLQVDQYLRKVSQGKLGLENCEIVREESGVLPMPYRGSYPGVQSSTQPNGLVLSGGYRGGWFHAATGYSFPTAIAFANWVANTPMEDLRTKIEREARRERYRAIFARFLNRLLFELVKPKTRYQIFRRFYSVLSEDRIARFYGHRFTSSDAARIVIGIPPRGLRPIRFVKSFFNSVCRPPRSSQQGETRPDSTRISSERDSTSNVCNSKAKVLT
ncbi:MAG: lycopene beta-cyclase CrtY, partial [Planctomycetota bacterium]